MKQIYIYIEQTDMHIPTLTYYYSSREIGSVLEKDFRVIINNRYNTPDALTKKLLFYRFMMSQYGSPQMYTDSQKLVWNAFVLTQEAVNFVILVKFDSAVSDKTYIYVCTQRQKDEDYYSNTDEQRAYRRDIKKKAAQFLVDFLTLRDNYYNREG